MLEPDWLGRRGAIGQVSFHPDTPLTSRRTSQAPPKKDDNWSCTIAPR